MNLPDLLILAIGLSMDAFAVAICTGMTLRKVTIKNATTVGLYFGIFQAAMPLIGYFVATWFADRIINFDHWIAFVLLGFLGAKMIGDSFKKEEVPTAEELLQNQSPEQRDTTQKPGKMLTLALATSIDALAVGISFAFLQVNVFLAVALIGIITFAFSTGGVKIGKLFGSKLESKAELAGGIILFLIGLKILLEHLGVINL
ncbi:MAG: manganese efflux pump MntP family protein [Lachnospiraceae bacterium]|jgi:putative Mn2+ efflux pump MntP|nr:manganese efflux pump MntP family protein [Lachnospiraceae bacterium]